VFDQQRAIRRSAVDVRIVELALVHVFVPETAQVLDGARVLIARTIGVDRTAFTLESSGSR
jgi:hypothetical protein